MNNAPYTLNYRRAEITDAIEIYNVLKVAGEYMLEKQGFSHWVPAYPLEQIKLDIMEKYVFVGLKGDSIIMTFSLGMEPYGFWLSMPYAKCLYSGKKAVMPKLQGNGYGLESTRFAEEFALKEGYDRIRCEVYDQNKRYINYLNNQGYKEVGNAPTRRFKVICMEKVLK